MRISAAAVCFLALTSCQREKRDLRPEPAHAVVFGNAVRLSELQPGGVRAGTTADYPTQGNAYAINEGQRLYNWYNCSGCHSQGGGGIGPPLIKKEWIDGGEPGNLFDTIVKGRPNGMPTWGAKIPEYQIWQIVAYVRSMNQEEPQSASPARTDTIEPNPHEIQNKVPGKTK